MARVCVWFQSYSQQPQHSPIELWPQQFLYVAQPGSHGSGALGEHDSHVEFSWPGSGGAPKPKVMELLGTPCACSRLIAPRVLAPGKYLRPVSAASAP